MNQFMFSFLLLFFLTISLLGQTQVKPIKCEFHINDKASNDFHLYLLIEKDIYPLPLQNGVFNITDTFAIENIKLMFNYKKDWVIISNFEYKNVPYLNIYGDNRLFSNRIRKQLTGFYKIKTYFKHKYQVPYGIADVAIMRCSPSSWVKSLKLKKQE